MSWNGTAIDCISTLLRSNANRLLRYKGTSQRSVCYHICSFSYFVRSIYEFKITERTCEKCSVRFVVLAALSLKIGDFCGVAPRPLIQTFRRIVTSTFTEPHGLTSQCTWI
jgi:hypothetical protein